MITVINLNKLDSIDTCQVAWLIMIDSLHKFAGMGSNPTKTTCCFCFTEQKMFCAELDAKL